MESLSVNYLNKPYDGGELERLAVNDSALIAGLRSHLRRDIREAGAEPIFTVAAMSRAGGELDMHFTAKPLWKALKLEEPQDARDALALELHGVPYAALPDDGPEQDHIARTARHDDGGGAISAPYAYTMHTAAVLGGYGWDAWMIETATGECIGDGWGIEPHEARVNALRDAEFTVGKLKEETAQ